MVDRKLNFEAMKPHLRAIKYGWLRWSAECRASTNNQNNQTETRLSAFIIGCGRSGTTLLGDVFAQHPQVNYLFEPYHLWAEIERRTDVLNLFHRVEGSLLMNASDYNEQPHNSRHSKLFISICLLCSFFRFFVIHQSELNFPKPDVIS